jgi:hypothetical protein
MLPTVNLLFDGTNLQPVDLLECLHGVSLGFELRARALETYCLAEC